MNEQEYFNKMRELLRQIGNMSDESILIGRRYSEEERLATGKEFMAMSQLLDLASEEILTKLDKIRRFV